MRANNPVAASKPQARRTACPTAMMWAVRCTLLAAALVAGCASRPGPMMRIESLENVGWGIAERPCTTPQRLERRQQLNVHDPKVMDEVIETHCAGLVATVYVANGTQPPKMLPVDVQLTAQHPALPAQLQVGTAASKVLA